MTAANAFCGPTAAYLLTDGASFDRSGAIRSIGSKAVVSEQHRVAAAMSGDECIAVFDGPAGEERFSPVNDVAHLLAQARTQSEFLASIPEVVRDCFAVLERARMRGFFQFIIALWNEAEARPETYVIGSPGHTFPSLPPFTLAGADPVIMPEIDRSLWPSTEPTRAEALAIIQEQRRTRFPDGAYRVGGFAELATVDASGVRTETICRWPDRIGAKIIPPRGRELPQLRH